MFASKTKHQSSSRDYNLTEITTKISDCVREYKWREKHNFRNEDLERDDSSDSYDDDETPASSYLRHYDGFSYYPSKSDLLVIYSIIVTIMQSEDLKEALSIYKRENIDWCINFISIIAPETVLQILTHNHVSDSSKMNIIELALEEVSKKEEDSSYVVPGIGMIENSQLSSGYLIL